MVINSVLSQAKAPAFFNMKNLSADGIARIDQTIKAARETLALADKLQNMRDATRTVWKEIDQLRYGSGLGGRDRKIIDISL